MTVLIIQILIFASMILSVYMILVTLERCRSEKRYGFVYCIITIFLYTLGYFIEISCGNLDGAVVAVKILYAGGSFMSPLFFFFVADYCEVRLPKKFYKIPLLIIPVLFYTVVLTFERHNLLYSNYYYDIENPIQGMIIEPGPLYFVGTFYPLFCITLTCIVLIRSIIAQSKGRRFGLILLLISSLAPLIANFSYVALSYFFRTALAGINFTAFVMLISNFIFFYNVIRNDMFDLAPKALAVTMDLIRDAFVILDRNMAYMGSNKKALELFPPLLELQKGASILGLENWPEGLSEGQSDNREIEFTLPHRPEKMYSGWTNRVSSESGATLGWVILIQDITETINLIRNIQSQRDEIAAMRDNIKEGLFLMDQDYRIQSSYSKAMETVLSGKNFHGKRFTDLLAKSYTEKDLETIAGYFSMIMDKTADTELLDEINPLGEFSYISAETGEHKTLRCLFAPVVQNDGEIFVLGTIQDISAETILKKQLAEEEMRRQDEMRSLFEVMQVDQKTFADFIEDSDYEFHRINQMLKDKNLSNRQVLINLYQSVHAIKSNAFVVGLASYGEKLHNLESEIKILRDRDGEPLFNEILRITAILEKRMQDKDKFLDIIKRLKDFSISGENTMQDEEIFIKSLNMACERVAADEQKKAVFTVKTFDKTVLNRGQRRIIKEILIQLIRNAVYHGIEMPEERHARGKDQTGTISLSVTVKDNMIQMVLEDDGRGLDFDRIAQKAEEQGLFKNPANKTDKKFLANIIFSPGFSTSESGTIHGGRGIGLNLVRDRLKEIHGSLNVRSKTGLGMAYDMQIPLNR